MRESVHHLVKPAEAETPEEAAAMGRKALVPWQIPWPGLKEVASRVWDEATKDDVKRAAATVAFYGFLALFPALIAVVSLYGLLADPVTLQSWFDEQEVALPENVQLLIAQQLQDLISGSRTHLTLSVVISLFFAWFSASKGVLSLIDAVNVAYNERETRGWLTRRWLAVRFTIGLSFFVSTSIVVLTILPPVLGLFGLDPLLRLVRFPLLGVSVMLGLSVLYRYAPNRTPARWAWVTCGAALASAGWLTVSIGLATYVDSFSRFNATYGTLGAIVALQLWFFMSAYAIVVGAELNAELEHQTAEDTTIGPPRPPGQRAAVMADSVAGTLPAQTWMESIRRALHRARRGRRSKK
jgi:membrane protein